MSPEELNRLLPYTKDFNMTEAQRIKVVTTVWCLMESFVDEVIGIHPVQLSCEQLAPDHLQSHNQDSNLTTEAIKAKFSKELSHDGKTTH